MTDSVAEKTLITRTVILNWLGKQMEAQEVCGRIFRSKARVIREASMRRRVLSVPVYVAGCNNDGKYDAVEYSEILRKLEDAWNEQEPEPTWALFLKPAA